MQAIFDVAKEPYKSVFKFLYLTGLWIGELGNLEWGDYNAERKHIVLRVMDGNKTKREEIVPLNKSAVEILETLKKEPPRKYIFVGSKGVKLRNSRIYSQWLTVAKKCGIENASPHTFRHTCASHLAIKGVSLYIIKEILRHASIKETEIYAHLSKEAVAGHDPLPPKDLKTAKKFVEKYAVGIVNKWIDFFVYGKQVTLTKITKRI